MRRERKVLQFLPVRGRQYGSFRAAVPEARLVFFDDFILDSSNQPVWCDLESCFALKMKSSDSTQRGGNKPHKVAVPDRLPHGEDSSGGYRELLLHKQIHAHR